MSNNGKKTGLSRRGFARQSACASLGITGIANSLAQWSLVQSALAADPPGGYKALVCLFLYGGMDSNNILIPAAGHPSRADYDSARGVLAIPDVDLSSISPDNTADPFGLNPSFAPAAALFNAGELAFVANTGSLAYPIATRDEYLNKTVALPPQLFSHSDQQTQWQSSIPDKPYRSGWGGRVAELINDSYNAAGKVSMNISLAGLNSFQVGPSGSVIQYAVTSDGAISLESYGTNYDSALNSNGTYKTSLAGKRLKAFEDIMRYSHGHLLEDGYNEVVRRSRQNEALIGGAVTEAAGSGVDFDAIFVNAQTKLGDQMKMIAKLIAGRGSLGNSRQIFFCSMGGYDTHQNENTALAGLADELGNALSAFSAAMIALGVNDQVVTCSNSDFTRTFTANKTDPATAGSDHGWGGHQIIMGGPVIGKNIYGQFPNLVVGDGAESRDVDKGRGRWIPTTSVDQYGAVLAKWLGVESSAMELIFPNLPRFDDPFSSTAANLQFIDYPPPP